MQNRPLSYFPAERFVYLFIFLHLCFWTLVPILVRHNLPLDAIEGTLWGHQLEWGYDKNPFLNAWLTALAVYLGGQSGWMIYLFSQISVAVCFWVVWRLGKNMLTPAYALIALCLLEGIQYYNFHSIDFNDNTLELGLWALTIYFFYQALSKQTTWAWILTGLFAGLGMMAKYYTITLLLAMALMLFIYPAYRQTLATKKPYLGLATFIAVILPHIIWLFFHEFITVTYVFARAASLPHWTNHFFFPAQFAWQQLQVFLPALVLTGFLLMGKKPRFNKTRLSLNEFDRRFLFYVGLGPFLLTVLLSFALGTKLRAGWGMPLLSLWGIILIALIQPALSAKKLYGFLAAIFTLMVVLLSGYAYSLIYSDTESSANFPGKEIAQVLTQEWRAAYHEKLAYVAGSRWVGGNIAFYSADHPAVFVEWDKKRAPWIDLKEMEQKGALFVWEIGRDEAISEAILKQFPQLQQTSVREFTWLRNEYHLPPIKLGVAWLPPASYVKA